MSKDVKKGLFQTKAELATVTDVLEGISETGKKVIILGGGQSGLVLADCLAEQNKEVAVLNRKQHFAEEMSSNDRFYLRERLKRDNVKLYKKVSVKRFTENGAEFKSAGKDVKLEGFDTVVISEKMSPVRDAKKMLEGSSAKIHIIGDAKSPRTLLDALAEADELGRAL